MAEEKLIQVQALINEFYSKEFYLSYSGLNKLLYSPSLFYKHYILQQREDKLESYLIDGKVIHCLLLDDGSFDKQFILTPGTLPTGNTRTVVDRIFDYHKNMPSQDPDNDLVRTFLGLEAYSPQIIEILKEINLHQSLKTDAQRLEKILTADAKSYFEFLKLRGAKDLIDEETLKRCNEAVDALRDNSQVCDLLGLLVSEMDNVDIHNELSLTGETDKPFGFKGVLDNIKVDHSKKIIYVNDLKTTGKTISDFKDTVEFYNYWAQAAIYWRLVAYKFHELLSDYKMVFNFIVVDKYNQVYPFEVSFDTMQIWQLRLEDKLKEAEWHYTNRNYTLPYQFATNKVIL
jgi:hypothetical protein